MLLHIGLLSQQKRLQSLKCLLKVIDSLTAIDPVNLGNFWMHIRKTGMLALGSVVLPIAIALAWKALLPEFAADLLNVQ